MKWLICAIHLLCFTYVHAQSIESVRGGNYTNGFRIDKLHKFNDLFERDQETLHKFKKFNRARVCHRVVNYSSIILAGGSIAAGTLIALGDEYRSSNIDDETVGAIVMVLGLSSTVILYGLSSAIVIPIKNKRKRKLLSHYNHTHLCEASLPKLNIVVGVYGVGISYHF